jgi:hypothetical protein
MRQVRGGLEALGGWFVEIHDFFFIYVDTPLLLYTSHGIHRIGGESKHRYARNDSCCTQCSVASGS